jgi:Fe-S oxidoreductase
MNPNGIENYCCGGGGGLVALPEYYEKRMRAGKAKSEQIKKTGAKIVAAACENCKLQLADLNNYYNLGVEVKGVVDLVAEAILNRKKSVTSVN